MCRTAHSQTRAAPTIGERFVEKFRARDFVGMRASCRQNRLLESCELITRFSRRNVSLRLRRQTGVILIRLF